MGERTSIDIDDHGVATLRLERPPVNALDLVMWDELLAAGQSMANDAAVRAVVITGGDKVFAAGADIAAMSKLSFQEMTTAAGVLQRALASLARLPQVVIAAINGYALGGGCELAMTADFRFAATNAKFGQPEVKLGLIPGAGGTQRLTRLVGIQKAKELVYSGEMITADEALAIGLVDRVCDPDEVYDTAVEAARRYAAGPFALRMAKQAIDDGIETDLDAGLRLETSLFAASFATEDAQTGMASFLEHGPGQATFQGR